jgi:hypothetical protein
MFGKCSPLLELVEQFRICADSHRLDGAKKPDLIMIPKAGCGALTISRQIDHVETALIIQRCKINVAQRLIAAAVNTVCHRSFIVT